MATGFRGIQIISLVMNVTLNVKTDQTDQELYLQIPVRWWYAGLRVGKPNDVRTRLGGKFGLGGGGRISGASGHGGCGKISGASGLGILVWNDGCQKEREDGKGDETGLSWLLTHAGRAVCWPYFVVILTLQTETRFLGTWTRRTQPRTHRVTAWSWPRSHLGGCDTADSAWAFLKISQQSNRVTVRTTNCRRLKRTCSKALTYIQNRTGCVNFELTETTSCVAISIVPRHGNEMKFSLPSTSSTESHSVDKTDDQ